VPLSRIEVEGYRAFADRTALEIRPLTLLFGYNSAGKSAIIRLLPLLAASAEPGAEGVLNLRAPAARGATFADLKCRLSARDGMRIALEWDDDSHPVQRIDLSILDLIRLRRQAVDSLQVTSSAAGTLKVQLDLPESESASPLNRYIFGDGPGASLADLDFEGLVPALRDETAVPESVATTILSVAARLRSLRTAVHWIGSLRVPPPRLDSLRGPVKRLEPDGARATQVLAFDGEVLEATSAWYAHATEHRLEIVRHAVGNDEQVYPALSRMRGAPVLIHLADTGEGMAQVLPVVTLVNMAKLGRLGAGVVLGLEQPELHLHPAAHAYVGGLLCELASAGASRALVETHSENLLLRIQLAVLRGEIAPERIVIYWLRQLDDGTSMAEKITLDDLARPEGDTWPPGVFSEDVEQARAIAIERRRRRAS
jgi:hypothetical protein